MDIQIEPQHACVAIWEIWPPLSAPMVEPGENKSSYSFSLENSLAGENQSGSLKKKLAGGFS